MSKPQPLDEKRQDTNKDTPRFKRFAYAEEDIKSACNFYLRYKDNPILFQKEQVEYLNVKIISIIEQMKNIDLEIDKFGDLLNQYNEWLFKLAFNFKEEK